MNVITPDVERRPTLSVSNGSGNGAGARLCLVCELPARGRSAYCSDAHRVKAFRLRHRHELAFQPDAVQDELRRRHRLAAHTVYACDKCSECYVGEQRCHQCNRFCRAVGVGGLCPGCDEPVLIADLLGEAQEVRP